MTDSQRKIYLSGVPWEKIAGYARAVRVGSQVAISGTTATDESGTVVGLGDAFVQTLQILRNVEKGLQGVGAQLTDVIRTRMFVVNVAENWEAVARAHGEIFGDIQPATTLVEVSGLINPDMLVEIEAEAIVIDSSAPQD